MYDICDNARETLKGGGGFFTTTSLTYSRSIFLLSSLCDTNDVISMCPPKYTNTHANKSNFNKQKSAIETYDYFRCQLEEGSCRQTQGPSHVVLYTASL